MKLNDSVGHLAPKSCAVPFELDRDIWLARLRAGVRPDSLAEALAQSQAALKLAETVAGLIGKADHYQAFAVPVLVLSEPQRRALINGVHLAASAAGRRLDEVFLDDRALTDEGLAAERAARVD